MIDLDELRDRLVGWRFPGASVTVEDYERWLAADAMLSPELPIGMLHPAWIFIIGLRGMGMTLDEFMQLAGSSADSGVMFGETVIEQFEPLSIGEDYAVRGEIVDVLRREGKRIGTFDLVTFRLEIVDDTGRSFGAATNSFVFPRRS